MKIPIFSGEDEGNVWLTNETPDGHLTLRSQGNPKIPDGDFKPSDILAPLDPPFYAASILYTWACEPGRSEGEIAFAREYLSQWPDGPQADPSSLKKQRAYDDGLKRAEAELGTGGPYLNEMPEFELRAKLEEMEEKLSTLKRIADWIAWFSGRSGESRAARALILSSTSVMLRT